MRTQQAAVPGTSTRTTKVLQSFLRVLRAVVVLVAVCSAWIVLFLLFAPFLLVAELFRLVKGGPTAVDTPTASLVTSAQQNNAPLPFDRRTDVSKLSGCNTRNVRYRWTLFEKHLELLRREFTTLTAMDFGAGSLRDSYEMAQRGFKVISFDLNQTALQRYFESYDWTTVLSQPVLASGSLEDLVTQNEADSLQLIIAFDVIEHLQDPAGYVQAFSRILCEQGFLFTIVPNGRSLFERYFKHSLAQAVKNGVVTEPGVPHVQFKAPGEWVRFFEMNGFRIVDRDMAIGHFVNDWWNGLIAIPLRMFVYPVLEVIAYRGKFDLQAGKLELALCPRWLMERVNVLDQLLKRWTNPRFGWNLIVAQKITVSDTN